MQKINTVENSDIKALIDKSDVISFDVFDTAILRPFLHHHEMYHILEDIFKYPKFCKTRIKAESLVRTQLVPKSKEEINLLDIYEHINVDIQMFINGEIMLDVLTSKRRNFVYQLYQYAISQGKRIIFVSDITYPKKAVEKILHKNGFSIYEKLYISADEVRSKRYGGMYEKVLFDLKIHPRKILHIGDSLKLDIAMANKFNIKTFYIPRPYHLITKFLNEKSFQLRKNLENSCLFGIASNLLFDNPKNIKNVTQEDLYTVPFIFKFVKNILKYKNNIFLVNENDDSPFFDIFTKIYTNFEKEIRIVKININNFYASTVQDYEDIQTIQDILSKEDFLIFLKQVYNITSIDDIKEQWDNVDIISLKIRKEMYETIKEFSQNIVYDLTNQQHLKQLICSVLQEDLPHFFNTKSVFADVVKSSLKNPLFKKFDINLIVETICELNRNDANKKFLPQINYFFTKMGKFIASF